MAHCSIISVLTVLVLYYSFGTTNKRKTKDSYTRKIVFRPRAVSTSSLAFLPCFLELQMGALGHFRTFTLDAISACTWSHPHISIYLQLKFKQIRMRSNLTRVYGWWMRLGYMQFDFEYCTVLEVWKNPVERLSLAEFICVQKLPRTHNWWVSSKFGEGKKSVQLPAPSSSKLRSLRGPKGLEPTKEVLLTHTPEWRWIYLPTPPVHQCFFFPVSPARA